MIGRTDKINPPPQCPAVGTKSYMNAQFVEDASKVIPEPQVLINMVSRRVRQLSAGSRPMVEVEFRMGLSDIALVEIAKGKLGVAPVVPVA